MSQPSKKKIKWEKARSNPTVPLADNYYLEDWLKERYGMLGGSV